MRSLECNPIQLRSGKSRNSCILFTSIHNVWRSKSVLWRCYAGRSICIYCIIQHNTTAHELTNNFETPRTLALHIVSVSHSTTKIPQASKPSKHLFYCDFIGSSHSNERTQRGVQTVGLESRHFKYSGNNIGSGRSSPHGWSIQSFCGSFIQLMVGCW